MLNDPPWGSGTRENGGVGSEPEDPGASTLLLTRPVAGQAVSLLWASDSPSEQWDCQSLL